MFQVTWERVSPGYLVATVAAVPRGLLILIVALYQIPNAGKCFGGHLRSVVLCVGNVLFRVPDQEALHIAVGARRRSENDCSKLV